MRNNVVIDPSPDPRGARQEFTPVPRRGTGLRKMRDKACYLNAWGVADRHIGYHYAEGFAMTGDEWIHHAFVVDNDGHAVDVTWSEPGCRYVGVMVELAAVAQAMMLLHGGDCGPVLDDGGSPFLRGGDPVIPGGLR